jgi:hypothetical protein
MVLVQIVVIDDPEGFLRVLSCARQSSLFLLSCLGEQIIEHGVTSNISKKKSAKSVTKGGESRCDHSPHTSSLDYINSSLVSFSIAHTHTYTHTHIHTQQQ